MPRLREVSREDAHPTALTLYDMLFGDRDPVKDPGTATGTPGNWWTVFAGVPDAFDHTTSGFAFYRSPKRELSPQLRELGQLRAGYARGSKFVYSQHCKASRDVGLSEEKIQAVRAWSVADCFSKIERAVGAKIERVRLDGFAYEATAEVPRGSERGGRGGAPQGRNARKQKPGEKRQGGGGAKRPADDKGQEGDGSGKRRPRRRRYGKRRG